MSNKENEPQQNYNRTTTERRGIRYYSNCDLRHCDGFRQRPHDKKGEDETNANAHSTNAHSTDSYADWVRNYARSEWGRKLISYIVDPGVEDCVKFHGVRALVNLVDEEEVRGRKYSGGIIHNKYILTLRQGRGG